jgi:hypothetical protein
MTNTKPDQPECANDYAAGFDAGIKLALRFHKLEHDQHVELSRNGTSKEQQDYYARWASMHSYAIANLPMFQAMHAPATPPTAISKGWSDETMRAVGASLDDGKYNLGMCRSLYAAYSNARKLVTDQAAQIAKLEGELAEANAKLNTPELHDFSAAVVLEAAHQRDRWGASHDVGKAPQDWFWLLGYLGGKALRAHLDGDTDKALHHCISSAAACANWHAAITGTHTQMRPGIDPVERDLHVEG